MPANPANELERLKAKLQRRTDVPGFTENVADIRARIAELEAGLRDDAAPVPPAVME